MNRVSLGILCGILFGAIDASIVLFGKSHLPTHPDCQSLYAWGALLCVVMVHRVYRARAAQRRHRLAAQQEK